MAAAGATATGPPSALINRGYARRIKEPRLHRQAPPPTNRMYMGPNVGAPGATPQQFFGNAPTGTNVNLAPPQITPPGVSPQAAGYDRGVASGLIEKPSARLTPTDIAWTPASEQWAAQQDLKAAVERGVPIEQAGPMYPAAFSGRGMMKPAPTPGTGPLTKTDANGNEFYWGNGRWIHVPKQGAVRPPPMDTITETVPAVPGSPGSPAVPKGTGLLGTGLFASPAQPAVPAVPGSPARRITRRVPSGTETDTKTSAQEKPVTDSSPQSKAARANALRKLHPDWSRQRILAEVNG